MRRDFSIALLCAISTIPFGVAMTVAPDYIPWLKEHPGVSFWVGIIGTVVLLAAAATIAIRGEQKAERRGARNRMIPLLGMIFFGTGFLGCAAWWFLVPSNTRWINNAELEDSPLAWNKTVTLNLGMDQNESPFAYNIQMYGKNIGDKSQRLTEAHFESALTGDRLELKLLTNRGIVNIGDANPIPPDADIHLITYFNGEKGIRPTEYMRKWSRVIFSASYEGKTYTSTIETGDQFLQALRPAVINDKPEVTKRSDR